MEHICFEVQLCIKILIFKGIWNIDILINLCLGTGLLLACQHTFICGTPLGVALLPIGPPKGIEMRDFNRFLSIVNHFSTKLIEKY